MQPGELNLGSVRGDPYTLRLPLVDDDTGEPLNLTGLTFASTMRRFPDSPDAYPAAVDESQLAVGIVSFTWVGDTTKSLKRVFARDVQATDGANDPVTLIIGTHTFIEDVTYGD